MSKLFYSLEETAQKLARSTKDVMDLVRSGQLQEFRDKDKLMFRIEAVDALAVDDGDIDLGSLSPAGNLKDASGADFSAQLGESASVSGLGIDSGAGMTPPSVSPDAEGADAAANLGSFSFDDLEAAAVPTELVDDIAPAIDLASSESASAIGMGSGAPRNLSDDLSSFELSAPSSIGSSDPAPISLSGSGGAAHINLADSSMDDSLASAMAPRTLAGDTVGIETISSGSGLLDLTREADDTSIGAALLDEVVNADDGSGPHSEGALLGEGSGSSLGAAIPEPALASAPMGAGFNTLTIVTAYDGKWSGTSVGLMLGAAASVGLATTVVITAALGGTPTAADMVAADLWLWTGGIAGGTALFGIIGFFVGRATE
ncbi:MAG: DNA-binding protein [Phycisphaerales bacterium]|nr:DNA-binding protein [Phycisphaerales bacterium]